MLSGEDYLNDYRALLPRGMNNVTVVELKELTDNKYIENVVDSKGNPCDARVTAKKIGNNDYEYYSCLICSEYQTEGEACLFDENNNVTDDSDDYEIEVDDDGDYELEAEGVYIVYQGDDFDVPYGTAYYKGEVVSDKVVGNPRIIDTNKLGTTIVKYVYHGKTAEITVKVIDRVKPSVSQVVLRHDDKNGSIYKGEWYSGDIYEEYLSTDYSKPGIEGSGVDYYELSRDGKTYERLSSNYHISTENGEQSYYVRSVDKSGNIGDANTYRVKIDKEVPSCSLKVTSGTLGNNNWYTSDVGIDFASIKEEVSSVVSQIISKKTITEETTGMTVTGMVTDEAGNIGSCSIQVKVDKTAPRITSNLTDGNYTNTQNVTYTASDSYSGIEAIQYEVYLNGNLHSSNHLQSQTATFNLNSSGTWEIYIKALDRAGHWDNGGNWSHYTYGINLYPYAPGQTWEFNYTGGVQEFTVPCSGTYQLEVYGAQGGDSQPLLGGKGGYSVGQIVLSKDNQLYIAVGQKGTDFDGTSHITAYNGGGAGGENNGGGGGATHIAVGLNLGELRNYESNKGSVLIVAGGGGGSDYENWELGRNGYGGTGGGINGGNGQSADKREGTGGTQTEGGYCLEAPTDVQRNGGFGYGGGFLTSIGGAGGGGGWYGGGAGGWNNGTAGGGGGSGYIGGVTNGSMQNGVRVGDGFARITLVSVD